MGQYTENELKRLHKIELDILKEIIRVCDANELDYWIDWGTLLGAVRHKGFIPWDDDIDICMPRDSYEKFLQVSKIQLDNDCVLQHYSIDKRTPAYCAKVRKNGTLFVEESVVNIPVHQGIFVDIYPVDNVPVDKSIREKYIKNATFWKQLYISKNIKKPSLPHSVAKKIILTIIRRALNIALIPVPRDWLYKKLDESLRQHNNCECEMLSCIGTSRGEHYKKEIYPLRLIEFEGIHVKAPDNIDAVLRKEYGNYMELPPVEKRVGHSPKYFSMDSSSMRDVK